MKKIKPTLTFLITWAFLNILMNIKYPAQQLHMLALFKVSPEVLGIMMITLAMAWMDLRFHPGLYLPLTVFVIFLRLFRFGYTEQRRCIYFFCRVVRAYRICEQTPFPKN